MTTVRPHYVRTVGALGLLVFAVSVLQTAVAPALPAMQEDLDASTAGVTWVLTATLLVAAVSTPIAGRLGDMFGKGRVLVIIAGVVAAGCVVAALSQSLPMLILGRAIQGIGVAVFPLTLGVIRDEFPLHRRAVGFGLVNSMWGVGGAAGFPLAGVIVDHGSYRSIFWVGLGLAILSAAAIRAVVPPSPLTSPGPLDWTGTALLSLGLGSALLAVNQSVNWGWTSGRFLGLLGGGVALLVWWTRWELRAASPLADLRLFRQRCVWTVNVAAGLTSLAVFSHFLLVPKLAETPASADYGFGATATEAGLYILPMAIVMFVTAPLAGALTNRTGAKPVLLAGMVVMIVVSMLLTQFHHTEWELLTAMAFHGLAGGLAFAALATLVSLAVPQAQIGEANGMSSMLRGAGGAVGATVVASILAACMIDGTRFPSERGYELGFGFQALAMTVALAVALLIPARRTETRAVAELAPATAPA